MKKFNKILIPIVFVFLIAAVPVKAAIIDFTGVPFGTYLTADYFEDGFKMDLITGHYDFFGEYVNIDNEDLFVSKLRFTDLSGSPFTLTQLDVVTAGGVITSSKGGSVSLSSTGTELFAGAAWKDIDWFEFTQKGTYNAIDNIYVSPRLAVPEPATLLLFGAGLIGLAGYGRKKLN